MASSAARDLSSARETIYQAISAIRLIDPHTHINPYSPASSTLADILGYHYYTELVHSAGMPRQEIEEPGISPRELVGRMVHGLGNITNTANYHWLIQICREFFDFTDDAITPDNWESLFDTAEEKMNGAGWAQTVLDKSNVEAVFLTNDFDDELEGFDSSTYIPCLRTDDLVFHLAKPEVRQRLERCSGVPLDGTLSSLRAALEQRFEHFVSHGARACAISIPPSFQPSMVGDGEAQNALDHVLRHDSQSEASQRDSLSRRVFWTLAELCDQYGLPFDLMIGVNRGVYPSGVYQGQDLYDSRVSLIQYRELFNAFPKVKFPISVLASVTNQELVSYSWIFPNVLTNGHWWYSNTPSFIHRDAAARLEAVPRNKQIAYYSDAYKLEFVLPKFDMYRRILARVLADEFVGENGWSEEKAIQLGRQVLRGNVDEVFRSPLIDAESLDIASGTSGSPIVVGSSSDDGDSGLAEEDSELSAFLAGDSDESDDQDGFATVTDDSDRTVGSESFGSVGQLAETIDSDEELGFLDPIPTGEEVDASEVPDVVIEDASAAFDATALDAAVDPQSLDVGDLLGELGDNPPGPDSPNSSIHMLAGDGEFKPDSDSMKLKPDPMTGELHFPVGDDDDDDDIGFGAGVFDK
ncbi:glucuronate isomerase [Stieleria sp. ICT_E10.1]|uniref:glucuronate isomerase n=1 Tax=Stieleria sedimenti TaxID=2976331 RepID=UPI00217F4672|nr:glucuronate isomerase [Stieleria sedimenti]MCS7468839.1 glucuronate isomerase [Stieleria sedimenti]